MGTFHFVFIPLFIKGYDSNRYIFQSEVNLREYEKD